MQINPDNWIHEATEREPGAHAWKSGKTAPEKPGMYERYFTDGIFRAYWDGEVWLHANRKGVHWRQVGDYPAWRVCEPEQAYIIVCRAPNGSLITIVDGVDERIMEFDTEEEAEEAAQNTMACRAFPYRIIGIDL